MCRYCEKGKKIEEVENDNIYFTIFGRFLRVHGRVLSIPLGRTVPIEYCPMCRKEAGRVIESYREIKFTEYVKHKGEPDWEIAWNKRMLELIDKDPTGGAKEKRLKNIRRWEEVKDKNAKRSD